MDLKCCGRATRVVCGEWVAQIGLISFSFDCDFSYPFDYVNDLVIICFLFISKTFPLPFSFFKKMYFVDLS